MIISEEQSNVLAKYLGCKCEYDDINSIGDQVLNAYALYWLGLGRFTDFKLDLKDIPSLTQEDFWEMNVEVYGDQYRELSGCWKVEGSSDIPFKEADWLRNNGYYLGEEPIKQFVKLQQ